MEINTKTYKLSVFEKWPKVFSTFYQYGFHNFSPEYGSLELNNTNTTKFIIYGENMKEKGLMCSLYPLENKEIGKYINEKFSFMNFYDDKIEIICSFNKKGKYLVHFLGNKGDSIIHTSILSYIVNLANNSKKVLKFSEIYQGHKLINIIEPIFDNLKSGKKVKFKLKSNINKIFIDNGGEKEYLEKDKEGFFEKEITIKGKPETELEIGETFGLLRSTYYKYITN